VDISKENRFKCKRKTICRESLMYPTGAVGLDIFISNENPLPANATRGFVLLDILRAKCHKLYYVMGKIINGEKTISMECVDNEPDLLK
jgi:hypothetical protein